MVFFKYLNSNESILSDQRQKLISNDYLYKIALKHDMDWFCVLSPFNSKHWCAPHLLHIFEDLSHIKDTRCINCLFNESFYWNNRKSCIGELKRGHYSFDANEMGKVEINNWIPKIYSTNRRPAAYTSKNMADLIESFIGVFFISGGLNNAMEAMVRLEILTENPMVNMDIPLIIKNELEGFQLTNDNLAWDVQDIEKILNYKFKNSLLLRLAYTVSGSGEGKNYERLEFLGDSVLDLMIVEYYYLNFKNLSPSIMSECKTVVVNNLSFGSILVKNKLHTPVAHWSEKIGLFSNYLDENPDITYYEMTFNCPKMLGDIFESIAGAVWLDCQYDMEVFKKTFYRFMIPFINANANPEEGMLKNPINMFLDVCFKFGIPFSDIECR